MRQPKFATNGKHKCDNCGATHDASQLNDIADFTQRVDASFSIAAFSAMAMGVAPCAGYVIKVTDEVIAKLGLTVENLKEQFNTSDRNYDDMFEEPESVLEVIDMFIQEGVELEINLHNLVGQGTVINAQPYRYNSEDGDRYDELEDNELYLIFGEDDLYHKTPTSDNKALGSLGIEPEVKMWTNFG